MSLRQLPSNFRNQQVPTAQEVFLDHTAHFVADLDDADAQLRRLGFQPSAANLQTNVDDRGVARPSGTSNKLVRLRRGFLEFLSATHDTPLAEQLRKARARYAGLHLIAFSHEDLETQRSRLVASGFDMQTMVHMRRRSQETGADVAWSVLRTQPHVMAEGRIQFVFPHTPELSWPEGSTEHPNQADSLTGVMLCVQSPQEVVNRFGSFLGRHPTRGAFTLDRGRVTIVDAQQAGYTIPSFCAPSLPYIGAITLATTNLDETYRYLQASGISPVAKKDAIIWIGPEDALGSYLGFHELGYIPM